MRAFDPNAEFNHVVKDAFQNHWGYVDALLDEKLDLWQQWIDGEKSDRTC